MPALARTHFGWIPFPLPLPMDEHIDIVAFNQNALDRKLQLNLAKGVEVAVDIPLYLIQTPGRQQQRLQRTAVLLYVGLTEGFHRLVDPENSVVVVFVLKGFPCTTYNHTEQETQKEAGDTSTPECVRVDHGAV